MLPIIDRFLVAPFLLPFGTLVGVLLAVRLATSSVSAHVDGLLFGLLLVTFTAGLIVFGGLVRSSEILALRASGASLIRIVRVPTLLALLVTVGFVAFIRIETDALGWWRIVAEAAAVPLAMIVALPLAVVSARKNDMWVVALLGSLGYACAVVVALGLQRTGVLATICALWLPSGLLAATAGLLFRRATRTR